MKPLLVVMRDELNAKLAEAIEANFKEIRAHQEELDIILSLDEKFLRDKEIQSIIEDTCKDARAIIADAKLLFKAAEIMARYS